MSDAARRSISQYESVRRICESIDVYADLIVRPSSFPPFVIELRTRNYPNALLAASLNIEAIRAAARLHLDPPPASAPDGQEREDGDE